MQLFFSAFLATSFLSCFWHRQISQPVGAAMRFSLSLHLIEWSRWASQSR
jgi:hypothetical protein